MISENYARLHMQSMHNYIKHRCMQKHEKTTVLTFSCLNLVSILISRSVLWQYVWCSKGEIFLIATFCLVILSMAALNRRDANTKIEYKANQVSVHHNKYQASTLKSLGIPCIWQNKIKTKTKFNRAFKHKVFQNEQQPKSYNLAPYYPATDNIWMNSFTMHF